jgi:hypothetical protein
MVGSGISMSRLKEMVDYCHQHIDAKEETITGAVATCTCGSHREEAA